MVEQHQEETGVTGVFFNELVYIAKDDKYVAKEDAPEDAEAKRPRFPTSRR